MSLNNKKKNNPKGCLMVMADSTNLGHGLKSQKVKKKKEDKEKEDDYANPVFRDHLHCPWVFEPVSLYPRLARHWVHVAWTGAGGHNLDVCIRGLKVEITDW